MRIEDFCHIENGMAFWHPRGWLLFRILEEAVRAQLDGYREVRTPQLLPREVWEASGHWNAFADGMFRIGDAALKPVSCPGHIAIVKQKPLAWSDLPIRLAELGVVHRDELSGSLVSVFRLKQFTQDDGHIFCRDDQVAGEVERFCRALPPFYRSFGFDEIEVALSLRPPNRLGEDAWWDRAEAELAEVAHALGLPVEVVPGAGAIYGPKLEFILRDRRGRAWQCGTVQLDFVMPQRFDVRYVDRDNQSRHVVMIHRALFGSLERFLGVLVDHYEGKLPPHFAYEQVAILPVGPAHVAHARSLAFPLRVRIDEDGSLSDRVAAAIADEVPYVIIVGDREIEGGTLAVRQRSRSWSGPANDVIAEVTHACANRCMQRA